VRMLIAAALVFIFLTGNTFASGSPEGSARKLIGLGTIFTDEEGYKWKVLDTIVEISDRRTQSEFIPSAFVCSEDESPTSFDEDNAGSARKKLKKREREERRKIKKEIEKWKRGFGFFVRSRPLEEVGYILPRGPDRFISTDVSRTFIQKILFSIEELEERKKIPRFSEETDEIQEKINQLNIKLENEKELLKKNRKSIFEN